MRKVVYAMSVSLDGFIEDRDGSLSWSYPDEELHKHFNKLESTFDIHLYGRGLYDNMAAFWPTADEDPSAPDFVIEYARIWRSMPKVVFSKTLDEVGWNSRLVNGNIAEEVNKLKAQPGKDMSVGGAGLAATFMQLGLIDEYRLYVHPVVLGGGKPVFPSLHDKINLQLVETRRFGSGVVLLRYQRAFERATQPSPDATEVIGTTGAILGDRRWWDAAEAKYNGLDGSYGGGFDDFIVAGIDFKEKML